ncbi:hypothetical protein AWU68_1900 [Corynebacterium simulans]|uniref:Transposase n=1 Tax=Corynebacterium simulans TaxID=146827 RepID=A0ABR5V7C4_9CORY|nr:hypothetical protein AWU68_1900 [Corynebacterium simulans]KXU17424.1 hypothetical protein WM41_1953 [Corynebacterium simulans]
MHHISELVEVLPKTSQTYTPPSQRRAKLATPPAQRAQLAA